MSKFKVGEKVWVKPCEEIKNKREHPGFLEEMNRFCGKPVTIISEPDNRIYMAEGWSWREEWLESEEEHNERIKEQAWAYSAATNADVKLCDNHTGELVKTFKVTGNGEIQEEKHVRFEDLPEKDQKALMEMIKRVNTVFEGKQEVTEMNYTPKRIIFNEPATVVFWKDGSKTVAKAHNETYDPEKGLAMCYAKKALGDGYEASKKIESLVKKYYKPKQEASEEPEVKTNPVVDLAEKLNQLEKDGVVLNRSKTYKFDDGQVVKYSKKIETWVTSLDKKA